MAATRGDVMNSAEMLPQCEFTKSSYFAFPQRASGSNSIRVPRERHTDVAPARTVLGKRSKMRKSPAFYLASAVTGLALSVLTAAIPAQAQTAADAALDLANMLDGAGGGVSGDAYLSALEDAADAGQPMAMWQLGTMYENGEGVAKDPAKAFGYFAQIANQHADAAPRGVESDIVAQSFVKMGDYYRKGVPDAGIPADIERSHALLLHAATYFGDADAQYRVGLLYLQPEGLGVNPLQSARWFSLAARKGHCLAQARLGDMLFNGMDGIEAQPIEGLMWLNLSHTRCSGTSDQAQVAELLKRASSQARPEDRANAEALALSIAPQFADF
ncbi:tetratricopeptide repeat protein [Devosia sp.]|uniref:tetratricopeptide repeat protein n=1 Tax=Devosia sp. TaxID=1871048 RepID=UPI001AC5DBBD|nr:tetratricopeptide repeat protein [Devosia sp.]MBN9332318.1 sel1 repeat family protein [Devosia sp.]